MPPPSDFRAPGPAQPLAAGAFRAASAILLLGIALGLAGCTAAGPILCRPGFAGMTVADLLFGRKRPDGRIVSEAEWRSFLAREVTPRFPDGLTMTDAAGQWRDPANGRIVREPAKRVTIVMREDAAAHARLAAAAAAYKQRFAQQSVGIVTRPACASF